MPPHVAARRKAHLLASAAHHQHVLHCGAGAIGEGLIDSRLEGHGAVLTEAAIGRDQKLRLTIDQPVPQGLGREAAEHHRMGGADAGAGQHGDRRLRHHRHVESHQIALADSQGLEGIGRLAHLGVELAVGEGAAVTRFPLPDQGRLFGAGPRQVAIETVEAEICGAALEPAGEGGVAPIEHGVERLEPVEFAAGLLAPEGIGIGLGTGRQLPVGDHRADPRAGGQIGRGLEAAPLLKHRFDRGGRGRAELRLGGGGGTGSLGHGLAFRKPLMGHSNPGTGGRPGR